MLNLRFGWIALAFFIAMGLFLESLHLVKLPFYFEVEIRRELWTLGHAHGARLAIVNIVFDLCARQLDWSGGRVRWAGRLFIAAGVLVPAGFFLGGVGNSESDPSLWIVMTPLGGLAALVAVMLAGWETWPADRSGAKLQE